MALNVLGGSGGGLEFNASIDYSQFSTGVRAMEAELKRITNSVTTQAKEVENFASKTALAVGGFLAVTAAAGFIKEMVNARGKFQKLEVSLETMLQSKEKADRLMADVVKLAATTAFYITRGWRRS